MTVTRKFRSLAWAATVAFAALGCYLISYRVSAERSALAEIERDIEVARDDILALNTEFQTRSRMSQLERWNRHDLDLASPGPGQYIEGSTELASLLGRGATGEPDVRHASADADSDPAETEENLVDEDVFEAPDEGIAGPRLQQASYEMPDNREERIAMLDEQLLGDIAAQADEEDGED